MSIPPVHGLRRGRLRRALAEDRRRGQGPADLRARQLVPARPGGRPLPVARLPRQPAPAAVAAAAARTARSRAARPPVGIMPDRGRARPRGHGHRARGPRDGSSPSTSTAGGRRWATARSTCAQFDRTCPRRSGRRTAGSPRARLHGLSSRDVARATRVVSCDVVSRGQPRRGPRRPTSGEAALPWPCPSASWQRSASVTVLLPPYDRPWWVAGLAAVVLALVVVLFVVSRRQPERTWLDPSPPTCSSPTPPW